MANRTGALLINLGTPDAPQTREVRRYLREFLMDPYVIDISTLGRWLLVHGIILPTRPARSAEAYRKVWTDRGSPLLFHTQDLTKKVAKILSGEMSVEMAMRYGRPNTATGLQALDRAGVDRIVVLPLYPQYSLAATESSIDWTRREAKRLGIGAKLEFVRDFHADAGFLHSFATVTAPLIAGFNPDHVLFSFHGIPERHVRKTDPAGAYCLQSPDCCERALAADPRHELMDQCYRLQSYATAHGIARRLQLPLNQYSVSFQSRLGRTPWIKPYTDFVLNDLVDAGVKRLSVICPSFVADCLETTEEIGIRGRDQFRARGGEELQLIPSLNSDDHWAQAVAEILRKV